MGNKISKDKLDKVNGGLIPDVALTWGPFHTGCKGKIRNVGNIFKNCVCEKCNETHYFVSSFNTYTVKQVGPSEYYISYSDGSSETVNSLPEECK